MKECPECEGIGKLEDGETWDTCQGHKEIEMTDEEVEDERDYQQSLNCRKC